MTGGPDGEVVLVDGELLLYPLDDTGLFKIEDRAVTGHRKDSCENGQQAQCGGNQGDIWLQLA
jgi:hypothetical protein